MPSSYTPTWDPGFEDMVVLLVYLKIQKKILVRPERRENLQKKANDDIARITGNADMFGSKKYVSVGCFFILRLRATGDWEFGNSDI